MTNIKIEFFRTQEEVSKLLGIDQRTVSRIEAKALPKFIDLLKQKYSVNVLFKD